MPSIPSVSSSEGLHPNFYLIMLSIKATALVTCTSTSLLTVNSSETANSEAGSEDTVRAKRSKERKGWLRRTRKGHRRAGKGSGKV